MDGGGGSGGRVALHLGEAGTGEVTLWARGGHCLGADAPEEAHGAAGTVVVVSPEAPLGLLLVDNEGQAGRPTVLVALGSGRVGAVQEDTVSLEDLQLPVVGSLPLLLEHLVRLGEHGAPVLRVVGHDAASLVLEAGDEAVADLVEAGQPIVGLYWLEVLVVSGGATLRSDDVLRVEGPLDTEGGTLLAPALERGEE